MILTLKFWRVFGVIAYIWRDLGLPPLIFKNRYLSHFQGNAVILVKTDKIGYKQGVGASFRSLRIAKTLMFS